MNDRVNILQGKKILIFPDVDAYDYWKEKFKARPKLGIHISDYLQKTAREHLPGHKIRTDIDTF